MIPPIGSVLVQPLIDDKDIENLDDVYSNLKQAINLTKTEKVKKIKRLNSEEKLELELNKIHFK